MRTVILVLAVWAAACGTTPPLSNTFSSPEALAVEVLAALRRGDEARLRALALTEDEFRLHVWPELPAARPERNLPVSYVWSELRQKSETALRQLIARYREQSIIVRRVSFAGRSTDFGTFEVRRSAIVHAQLAEGPVDLRVCGSMVRTRAGWKVFSYVVDD